MNLSRRDFCKQLLIKNSAQALHLFAATGLGQLMGIGDDSEPSAEKAGLALRTRRKASAWLKLSGAKSYPGGSQDSCVVPEEVVEVEPKVDPDDEGRGRASRCFH